jgi:diguanylate cyclase
MRYGEDRKRSEEVMRQALPLMGRQAAAFNPYSYAIWYEHCAGVNPGLSRALEGKLATSHALTDEEVWQLFVEHVVARDVQTTDAIRDALHKILGDTAASAKAAGERTAVFDQALSNHAQKLSVARPPEAVREVVADMRSETGKMRAMTAELAAKLKASTEEVTVLKECLERAQTDALLDLLTGLKNRRGFEQAASEVQSPSCGELKDTALLMLDIDGFKRVNDAHGHQLGDKVLRAIAHALKSSVKGRDVVARLGGDEFAVLLPGTNLAGATALGRQICSLVGQGRIKRADGGTLGQVTLSIGIAVGEEGETLDGLMERADKALYTAKRGGRNRVEIATRQPNN